MFLKIKFKTFLKMKIKTFFKSVEPILIFLNYLQIVSEMFVTF